MDHRPTRHDVWRHPEALMIDEDDMKHLGRCVELATQALETGNPPFGSVLVDEHGDVRS